MSRCPKCSENTYKYNEILSTDKRTIWTCRSCGHSNEPSKEKEDDFYDDDR